MLQTVADLGTISAVNIQGAGGAFTPMVNTYGAAWEISNQPAYPISLEVTSGSQTVSIYDLFIWTMQHAHTATCLVYAVLAGTQLCCSVAKLTHNMLLIS